MGVYLGQQEQNDNPFSLAGQELPSVAGGKPGAAAADIGASPDFIGPMNASENNQPALEPFIPEGFDDLPAIPTTEKFMARQDGQADKKQSDVPDPAMDRTAKMEAALRNVVQYDLSRDAAAILRDSARLHMSPDELLEAPDFIRKPRLTRDELVKTSNRYPTVSSLLADPWIMAAFGNPKDIKELGKIENSYGTLGRTIARMVESWEYTWIRDSIDLLEGNELVYGSNPEWTATLNALRTEMARRKPSRTISLTDPQKTKIARGINATESAFSNMIGGPAQAALFGDSFLPGALEAQLAGDLVNAGLAGGLPEAGARGAEVMSGMVHSLSQPEVLALIVGSGITGSFVPGLGTVGGMAGGGGTGLFMMNYLKGLGRGTREARERGVPEKWAQFAGSFTGLMTAFTETAQFGVAAAPAKSAAKAVGRETVEGLGESLFKKYAKEAIERMAEETGLEMAQETLEMLSQDFATLLSNQFSGTDLDFNSFQDYAKRNWETFKFMALGGAPVGTAGLAASLPGDVMARRADRRAQAAQADARNKAVEALVKEISEAIADSEAMRAAPEAAGAVIERIAQDKGGPQTFYVEAETVESFRQSAFEQEGLDMADFEDNFLAPMGLTAEQYLEAVDMGTSLEMSVGGIPAVKNHPVWAAIEQSEGLVRAEPRNLSEERAAILSAEDDPFLDFELPPEMTEEIKKQVSAQFEAAGMPAEQARTQADLLTRLLAKPLAAMGVKDIGRWFQERLQIVRKPAGNAEGEGGQVLHQPMNAGLDTDRPVRTVVAEDRLPAGEWHQLTKGATRNEVVKQIATIDIEKNSLKKRMKSAYVNAADTQWTIDISLGDGKHSAGRVSRSKYDKRHHMQAVAHLPELIREMVLVESHADVKNEGGLKAVHRFFAPFETDGTPYSVKITVKEYESGVRVAEIEDMRRAYSLSLEKEMPGRSSTPSISNLDGAHQGSPVEQGQSGSTPKSEYSIRELIEAVNDSEGQVYLQSGESNSRGQLLTPEQVRTADEALARDAAAWGESIDKFLDGTLDKTKRVLMLQQTPLVLQMLGAKNIPVGTTYEVLKKILVDKHKLPVETIKQVPAAMADPIMVFKSATQGGDLVMMLELKDQDGATVVVPISLEGIGPRGYTVNMVKSVYGRRNPETLQPNDRWFINQISQGNLLYRNNGKSRAWAGSVGLQLPPGGTPANATRNRIRNYDDLVKLREKNPGMYQSDHSQSADKPGPRGMLEALADGTFRMTLFEGAADASTPVHESAHLFVEVMREVLATAPEHVSDWTAFEGAHNEFVRLAEWAGQKDPYGQWSTEAHEKLARGFEAYLMEGRAPAEGLRGIFAKMKNWLLGIYKDTRKLNVELTDEVREVFDRLLATEDEIMVDSWRTSEPKGLDPEIQAELDGPRQEARQAMEAKIRQKRLAEVNKMRSQWKKEGAAEADLDPHQIMVAEIVAGGGISLASLKAGGYDAADVLALNRKRPGLVSSKGKSGFDEIASRYGYGQDSDAFIQALKDGPSRKKMIDDYAAGQEAYSAEWLGEDAPITEEEINLMILEAEAERLKGNKKEAVRVLRETSKALKKEGGVSRWKRAIQEKTGLKIVDDLSRQNMADLKASLRRQVQAAREGSTAGAAAKRIEMAMKFREEQKAKNFIAKMRGKWKRFVNQKPASPTSIREAGIDPEFSVQAKKLLNQFGFNIKESGRREIQDAPDLATFIRGQYDLGNDIYAPAWVQEGRWPVNPNGSPKTLGQLSLDQFQDLSDTIDSILHAGRENQKLLAGRNRMTFDEAAKTINDSITENMKLRNPEGPEPKGRVAELAGQFAASLEKAEFIIRRFDGFKTMGKVWEILFAPLKKAEDKKIELGEKIVAALSEAWKDFSPADRRAMGTSPMRERLTKLAEKHWIPVPKSWRVKRHTFEGAPNSLTEAEIISTFANLGNPENMANLVEGNGFTLEGLAAVCDFVMARPKLLKAAMDMTKAIDQLYSPLAEVHYKATGVTLAKVDPGEITLPNGVAMAGWYFPIVRDPDKSNMAYQRGQASTAGDTLASMGMGRRSASMGMGRRSARSGASHQRTGAVGALSLSLDVINKHVQDTVQDISHRLAVRDIQRLLNRDDVRETVISHAGRPAYEQLQSWINWVAKPQSPKLEGVFAGMDWIRRNTVAATLAFNVNTPIMQLMGFSQSVDLIGFSAVSKGVRDLILDPGGVSQFVRDNSPSVRARDQGFDQDIQEVLKGLDGDAGILASERQALTKAAFWGIKVLDQVVVYATWAGAYNKAIGEGQSLEYAREYADTAVRMTQPLASPKDTAAIQRDPRGKILAMYYTFFSGFHNRMLERYRGTVDGKLSAADLMTTVMWTIIVPTMLTWMYQQEDIPDDLEDVKSLLWDAAAYSVSGVPVVRDVISSIGGPFRYELSPVAQFGGSLSTTGRKFTEAISGEGDFDETLGKSAVRSAGYLFGLPSNQALRTWDGMWKMVEGETENPVRLFKPEPRE